MSSRHSTMALVAGTRSRTLSCVSTTPTRASSTRKRRCSAGYVGSSGRYAPPALSTPRIATTNSTDRSRQSPTTLSGPTPRARSSRASALARAFNTPYVTTPPSPLTATAPGARPTCPSNNSCRQSIDRVGARRDRPVGRAPADARSASATGCRPGARRDSRPLLAAASRGDRASDACSRHRSADHRKRRAARIGRAAPPPGSADSSSVPGSRYPGSGSG